MAELFPAPIGVLLNPRSGRARRQLQRLHQQLAALPDTRVLEASKPADIARGLPELLAARPALLVMIGGDGTLQALLTALLHQEQHIPPILVVSAGTTNMSARALGTRLHPHQALLALARWKNGGTPPRECLNPVLQVTDVQNGTSHFGLFFGTGAISSGVRYFHNQVKPRGVRGALGPALAFARLLFSAVIRTPRNPLLPALPARIQTPTQQWEGQWLFVLASTLEQLLVGSRPYWGTEAAPMHFTAIRQPPLKLGRRLPWILTGRGARVTCETEGYISHNSHELVLEGLPDYILDGEQFTASGPVRVSATAALRFLTF